jgi:hypothetical protein
LIILALLPERYWSKRMPNAGRIGNRLEAASGAPGQHMVLDCMERYIMARKNARNPLPGGRYLGFPKYVADEITLARSGESRAATAKHRGVEQLALDFKPGTTRQLAPWERELAEDKAFFKEGDFYLLVPPGQGPRIRRISLDNVSEPTWSPEHGMIRVRVNPSQSWAGLIPNEGPFPGTYNHFIGGASLGAVWLS